MQRQSPPASSPQCPPAASLPKFPRALGSFSRHFYSCCEGLISLLVLLAQVFWLSHVVEHAPESSRRGGPLQYVPIHLLTFPETPGNYLGPVIQVCSPAFNIQASSNIFLGSFFGVHSKGTHSESWMACSHSLTHQTSREPLLGPSFVARPGFPWDSPGGTMCHSQVAQW